MNLQTYLAVGIASMTIVGGTLLAQTEPVQQSDHISPGSSSQTQEFATLEFAKDSAVLSPAAEASMRALLDDSKAKGGVHEIKVAVWSDQESPAKARKNLPKADQKLAELRGDNIKNFLKFDLNVPRVHVYNMAEGTNWIAEMFRMETAQLHEAFSAKGYKHKLEPEVALFKDHGSPSHAVLVVDLERKTVAH